MHKYLIFFTNCDQRTLKNSPSHILPIFILTTLIFTIIFTNELIDFILSSFAIQNKSIIQ